MSWSGGVFTRTNGVYTGATTWVQTQSGGFGILASQEDTHDQDLATGLNNCMTIDGLNKAAANITPSLDATYNLGGSSARWQNLYVSAGALFYNGSTNAVTLSAGTLTAARSVTFGDFAGVVVIDTATQTLTNKTLTSPTINAGAISGTFSGAATFSGALTLSGSPLTMSGAAVNEAFTTIASASTVNIGAAAANYLQVTGTTTITAFDTVQAGTQRVLEFAGALTLTQNATSLILPGSQNIKTAAGDIAIFRSEGSGNWRCISYTRGAAGMPGPGVQAWANVQSNGTVNAGFNVLSVTHVSTGIYTFNFVNSLPDGNYAPVVTVVNGSDIVGNVNTLATGSFGVTIFNSATAAVTDSAFVISVFR